LDLYDYVIIIIVYFFTLYIDINRSNETNQELAMIFPANLLDELDEFYEVDDFFEDFMYPWCSFILVACLYGTIAS
jgi:hypothetical protein